MNLKQEYEKNPTLYEELINNLSELIKKYYNKNIYLEFEDIYGFINNDFIKFQEWKQTYRPRAEFGERTYRTVEDYINSEK